MTLDTLLLLRRILSQQTLQVGADDFVPTAMQVIAALTELDQAIDEKKDP